MASNQGKSTVGDGYLCPAQQGSGVVTEAIRDYDVGGAIKVEIPHCGGVRPCAHLEWAGKRIGRPVGYEQVDRPVGIVRDDKFLDTVEVSEVEVVGSLADAGGF